MALIGIHGRKYSGKDRGVGDRLVDKYGYARLAFANPIKDGLVAMLQSLGVDRASLEAGDKDAPIAALGCSRRQLMQSLGHGWGRCLVREDLWIAIAEIGLKHRRLYASDVVVTDVRYEDEAAWVRGHGGAIWHLTRPGADKVRDLHPSEAGIAILPGIDSVIVNDQGLEQLWDRVRDALAGECVA